VGLIADLGRGRIGVDTSLFIYFMEEDARFLPAIEPLFREADEGRRELVTSALTRRVSTCHREISQGRSPQYRSRTERAL